MTFPFKHGDRNTMIVIGMFNHGMFCKLPVFFLACQNNRLFPQLPDKCCGPDFEVFLTQVLDYPTSFLRVSNPALSVLMVRRWLVDS